MPIVVTSDRAATARTAVAFCCDATYATYALHAASQIATLHPDRGFDIVICSTEDLTVPASLAPLGLRVCRLSGLDDFVGLGLDARRTVATYLRLALPAAFADTYDRILYLDSDVHVQASGIDRLLTVDMCGRPVAAVRDNIQWRTPTRMAPEFKTFGLASAPYFNAGVLLIDVPRFMAEDLLARALAFGREGGTRLMRNDQTVLNCVLHRNWAEIGPHWNWQYSRAARLFEAMADVRIVHFIGPVKPWADPAGTLPPRFSAALSRFVAAHLPAKLTPPVSAGPMADAGAMRRMLWRHFRAAGSMRDYLARFPTPLTVVT